MYLRCWPVYLYNLRLFPVWVTRWPCCASWPVPGGTLLLHHLLLPQRIHTRVFFLECKMQTALLKWSRWLEDFLCVNIMRKENYISIKLIYFHFTISVSHFSEVLWYFILKKWNWNLASLTENLIHTPCFLHAYDVYSNRSRSLDHCRDSLVKSFNLKMRKRHNVMFVWSKIVAWTDTTEVYIFRNLLGNRRTGG